MQTHSAATAEENTLLSFLHFTMPSPRPQLRTTVFPYIRAHLIQKETMYQGYLLTF